MSAQKQTRGEIAAVLLASRAAFASTALFSCLVNILMLTGPLFMLQVYDRVLTSGSVPTLVGLVIPVGAILELKGGEAARRALQSGDKVTWTRSQESHP